MKKQLATLLLAAALTLWALPASAEAAPEGVQLETSGGSTAVTLTLPEEIVGQGITSLQLSFAVQGGDVKFDFADNLPATVQEYRYQNDTLTIYLSGRDALLNSGTDSIRLGEVRVTKAAQDAVTVTFAPDSLRLLNAANGAVEAEALPEAVASIPAGGQGGDTGEKPGNSQSGNQNAGSSPSQTPQPTASGVQPTATPVPDAAATLISPAGGTAANSTATRKPAAGTQTDSEVEVPGTIPTPSAQPGATAAPQPAPEADADSAAATAESAVQQPGGNGLPILPIAAGVAVLAVVVVVVIRRLFF